MPKYYGMKPAASTRQAVEQFEQNVMIRENNQILVGTVYADMQDTLWGLAIGYNYSRNPGLHGHENLLEVRYSYDPAAGGFVKMFRSEPAEEKMLVAGRLPDPDAFIRYALRQERSRGITGA